MWGAILFAGRDEVLVRWRLGELAVRYFVQLPDVSLLIQPGIAALCLESLMKVCGAAVPGTSYSR